MKLSTIFFAALATAASSQFSLKARTVDDKSLEKVPIKKVDSHPHVFSVGGNAGEDLVVQFQKDEESLVDSTGRGVNVDPNTGEVGSVAPFGRAPATKGFSLLGKHLRFDNADHWRACPSGENQFSLTIKDGPGCKTIQLEVEFK